MSRGQPGSAVEHDRFRWSRGPARTDSGAARGAPESKQDAGGHALHAFGTRLAVLFLVTAVLGLPLMTDRISWTWAVGIVTALVGAVVLVLLGFPEAAGRGPLLLSLVAAGAIVAALLVLAAGSGDPRTFEVIGWLMAGIAGGIGVARGPAWGLGTYLAAIGLIMVVDRIAGAAPGLITILGPLTFCLGGVAINVTARRGFASSQQALEAAETAEAAHRVVVERSRARRVADRELHDTVLATLTLLAHGGVGVRADRLRERCGRDVAVLQAGTTTGDADPEPAATAVRAPGSGWLDDLVEQARDDGLGVVLHLEQDAELSAEVVTALRGAVAECLANVRRHAGVQSAEVTCGRSGRQLVLVVLDLGVGFDPGAVPADRLGLRAGVRDRIADVRGSVSIWSAPWQGTSIVLRVPLPDGAP